MEKPTPPKKKIAAYRRGFIAEYKAALFLLLKGYHILSMRFRAKGGEIDIIARKGDLIVFVEVKAREQVIDALAAVGPRSRQRIRAASHFWLSKNNKAGNFSWRYDIIVVRPWKIPTHFISAF